MGSTQRVQFLDYTLVRSGRFTANEHALLNVIMSFSDHCQMSQEYLAKAMNKSIATVRRTINSLISKGIIDRTYTVFKRCVIRIVSLERQKQLMTVGGIVKQAIKAAKRSMKSSHRSPMSEVNRSPMSEPTRSETERNKTNKAELNFFNSAGNLQGRMSDKEFLAKRAEQLAKFHAKFC